MQTLNQKIDEATRVYMWISTTQDEGKYVLVDKEWMKRLVAAEFEDSIDFSLDHGANEIYFH